MLYLASGRWSAGCRRRRFLTERDFEQAGQWHRHSGQLPPDQNPLLVSLDLALRDGCDTGLAERLDEGLPPGDGTR